MLKTDESTGLLLNLNSMGWTVLNSVKKRLQMAHTEMTMEGERLIKRVTVLLISLFLGVSGLFLSVMCLIWFAPESWRAIALGCTSLIFFILSGLILWIIRQDSDDYVTMQSTLGILEDDFRTLMLRLEPIHKNGD